MLNSGQASNTVSAGEIITAAEIDEMDEATLIRVRGEIYCRESTQIATVGAQVWYGICVLPSTVTAGGGQVPGPFSDGNWHGWLLHGVIVLEAFAAASADTTVSGAAIERRILDGRGMRRVNEDNHIFWVTETRNGGPIAIYASLRLLFKLAAR